VPCCEEAHRVEGVDRAEHLGAPDDPREPAAAMLTNHSSVAGPKTAPTLRRAALLHEEEPHEDAHGDGHDEGCTAVVATSRPSTAESTEMAGVMIPSP
jgi:hypothetical protein